MKTPNPVKGNQIEKISKMAEEGRPVPVSKIEGALNQDEFEQFMDWISGQTMATSVRDDGVKEGAVFPWDLKRYLEGQASLRDQGVALSKLANMAECDIRSNNVIDKNEALKILKKT